MTEKPFAWIVAELEGKQIVYSEEAAKSYEMQGYAVAPVFVEAQLTAAREEAREKALEEAATIADAYERAAGGSESFMVPKARNSRCIAKKIRALQSAKENK